MAWSKKVIISIFVTNDFLSSLKLEFHALSDGNTEFETKKKKLN